MKKYFAISFILGLFIYSESLSNFDAKVNLIFDNGTTQDSRLIFGAVTGATDSLDRDLGETYIPPMPPPEFDLFVVFNWDTNDVSGKWSYVDLRSVPEENDEFYHRYKMIIYKRINSIVNINWANLPATIKSAVISDRLGGLIFSADMKNTNEVVINNTSLEKIDVIIDVLFDKKGVSVTDYQQEMLLYPNPARDYFTINENMDFKLIEIYNSYGELVGKHTETTDRNINISNLINGVYFVRLYNYDNSISIHKLLKI